MGLGGTWQRERDWHFGSQYSESILLWPWQYLSTVLGISFYPENGSIYAKKTGRQNLPMYHQFCQGRQV